MPNDRNLQATQIDWVDSTTEKPVRRESFPKSVIASLPLVRDLPSSGLSKEHSEQGRVKKEVYLQYLRAASRTGFFFFVLAMVSAQVMSVVSTFMLRLWSESNHRAGENSGLNDPYLIGYGFFNLTSILMAAVGGLLLWVLCTLRSAKYLHDGVRGISFDKDKLTNA